MFLGGGGGGGGRNAVRMLPIEKTCAVQMDKVLELIEELARPHFPPNPLPGQKKPVPAPLPSSFWREHPLSDPWRAVCRVVRVVPCVVRA